MLSRVAESLYWLARYIERAEDVTRLLAVNFNALLDVPVIDDQRGWQAVLTITGDEGLFKELYPSAAAPAVIDFLLWQTLNPNAVSACITRARENARGVREQISNEMWEHINRLYFLVREVDHAQVAHNPSEFFRKVRDGAQAFQGISTATMTHGEAYEFIQLGLHLERADKTTRILNTQYLNVLPLPENESALPLISLLRSCSAFEPFRRAPGKTLTIAQVAEYLLLNREFPRATLFCVNRCVRALENIGTGPDAARHDHPRRTLGRLSADLDYLDPSDVFGEPMDKFLSALLLRLNHAGDEISRAYFNTRVILTDERPRQQQQQQQ